MGSFFSDLFVEVRYENIKLKFLNVFNRNTKLCLFQLFSAQNANCLCIIDNYSPLEDSVIFQSSTRVPLPPVWLMFVCLTSNYFNNMSPCSNNALPPALPRLFLTHPQEKHKYTSKYLWYEYGGEIRI